MKNAIFCRNQGVGGEGRPYYLFGQIYRAQCSVQGVSSSNPAKINIFIVIALVSPLEVDAPTAHFVRAQCSVPGVSSSNPAKINFFF